MLHPELAPFIGKKYEHNVLFIGESHFLPSEYDHKIGQEWYYTPTTAYKFTPQALAFLNTTAIIRHDVIESVVKNPSHSIYRTIGDAYGEVFGKGDYRSALEYVAFSNYFLRPAEVCGGSIELNSWDEEVLSYQNLVALDKKLAPKRIIFVSKKARQSFHRVRHSADADNNAQKLEAKMCVVPHPASAWWNRPSASYANMSGRELLRRILQEIITN